MNPIVSAEWLSGHMEDANIRIVDCRFDLTDPELGMKKYEDAHIKGAVYANLEMHLSGEKQKHGGRHPLPNAGKLQAVLKSFGINEDTVVVAYDNGEAMYAGRLWWLLSYAGHEHVFVLDGGYDEWEKKGLPISSEVPLLEEGTFTVKLQPDMLASLGEVKSAALERKENGPLLMDARAPERYNGETEPLDRVPGHIPGAVNHFFKEGFNGRYWKVPEQQKKRFKENNREQPIIAYCGSGVSATPNIIALKQAGFTNVKLYAGSYSDWSSYENLPVEKNQKKSK